MGHREVPPGAAGRVPRLRAARRSRRRRSRTTQGDHVGVHRQKDGRFYVGATPIVGRVSGPTLAKLADLVEAHGSTRLRTTPHQKFVILDIPEDRVESLIAGLDELGLSARPSLIRRGTIACTGIEFCKLAIVETKAYATAAVLDLEERLEQFELPHPISLHVNGCPNSCARIQTADIGLKGQLVTIDGEQVPGYQVHLGGGLVSADRDEAGLGRTVRGLKVSRRRHRRLRRAGRQAVPRRPGCRIRRDVRPVGAPRRRGGPAMTAFATHRAPFRARPHSETIPANLRSATAVSSDHCHLAGRRCRR